MNSRHRWILSVVLVASFAFSYQVHAQTTNTYQGPLSGATDWTNAANWTGGAWPNSVDAVAIFTNTSGTNSWASSTITAGTINVTNLPSGSVIVGNGQTAVSDDILELAASSGKPLIAVSTNSSVNLFIYATVAGTNGFTKAGSGNLTFRFNTSDMSYSGDINLNAGTLTINQDGSLGNADNDIFVGGNSTLSLSPGNNSGTVTLGSGRSLFLNSGTLSVQTTSNSISGVINGTVSGSGALTLVGPSSFGSNSTTVNSYTLNGANTYAGQTIVQLGAKVALGVGAAISTNTLSFSGGNGSFAQLDLGGNTQSVASLTTASSTATARTMVISNGALNVGSGGAFTLNGINGTMVNLSGLTSFTFNGAAGSRNITITPDTISATATNTNAVYLASAGIGSNNISAAAMTVGGAAGTSQGGNHQGQLHLGKVNIVSANSLTLGGFNGSGLVTFQNGVNDGSLTLRGSNGIGRMGTLVVGATSSGTRDGSGSLNTSNGTINALISNSYVGVFGANSTGPTTTSQIIMTNGTFDTLNLVMATITNTSITNASAQISAVFQQNGGNVLVETMILGDSLAVTNISAPKLKPTYNLAGGTLAIKTVVAGSTNYDNANTTRQIVFSGGVLKNYPGTNASIDGAASVEGGGFVYLKGTGPGQKRILVESNTTFTLGAKTFLQIDSGELLIDAPNAIFASSARVGISRNLTNQGVLTLLNGTANFNTAGGTFGLADNTTAMGRVNVFGGTMTITLGANRFIIGNRGTGVVTVSNGATLNIGGTNHVCVGSDFLYADSSGSDLGNGSINLDGGIINVSGTGRLVLGAFAESINASGTGTLNLNNGTFATARSIERDTNTNNTEGRGSATVNLNGATLKALANNTNWITVTNLFVNADTIIDTDTNNVSVSSGFLAGSNGVAKVTKTGAGILTLSGANTYTGDTDVNAGALSLLGTVASPSINVASGAALVMSTVPLGPITNNIVFATGAKIRVNGTPVGSSVNLLTTSGTISGSPELETAIPGYTLVTSSTAITLLAAGDTTPPSITLRGDNPMTISLGASFTDPGADVTDNVDLTRLVYGAGTVNVNQAGNYSLTYTASDAANNAASPIIRTVEVTRGSPTLSGISATPIAAGQAFADSTLSGTAVYNGGNVAGTWVFAAGQTLSGSGNYNVVFNPTDTSNYNPVNGSVNLTVNPANSGGSNFSSWGGGGPTNSELVGKYAIGGASNSSSAAEKPVVTVDSNTLSLSAIVRTNDAKLNVVGEAGGSLTNWSTSGISVTASANTNGVPDGHQRQVFSVDRTNAPAKQFLRLRATLTP